MDPRVFNASVLVGLLLVAGGVGAAYSWPLACIVAGSILIVGTFCAAFMVTRGSE